MNSYASLDECIREMGCETKSIFDQGACEQQCMFLQNLVKNPKQQP